MHICLIQGNIFHKNNSYVIRNRVCYFLYYDIVSKILAQAALSLFLSFSLFSPSSAFDPLPGISRAWKFVSPNILAKLEDIWKKKLKVIFIFYEKKLIFGCFFFFSWPAFGHGHLGHPQSLEYYVS